MGQFFLANTPKKLEESWKINAIQNRLHSLMVARENRKNEKLLVIDKIQEVKDDLARAEIRIEIYRWVLLLNQVLEANNGIMPDTNLKLDPPILEDHKELFALVVRREDEDGEYRQIVEEIKAKHLMRVGITNLDEVDKMNVAKSEKKLEKYFNIKQLDLNTIAAYEAQINLADQLIAELDIQIRDKQLELQMKSYFFEQQFESLRGESYSQKDCAKEEYLLYTRKHSG